LPVRVTNVAFLQNRALFLSEFSVNQIEIVFSSKFLWNIINRLEF